VFGRVTIMLGIGPHSSFCCLSYVMSPVILINSFKLWCFYHNYLRQQGYVIVIMAALHSRYGYYILVLFLLLLFPRLISAVADPMFGCLPYFNTQCGPSANLECRFEMCCMQLTGNPGPKKIAKKFAIWAPSHNFVRLYLRN